MTPPTSGPTTGTVAGPAMVRPPTAVDPRMRARRLRLTQVDPWSVAKMSFLLSLAAAIVTVVALVLLWIVLAIGGVFSSLDTAIVDIVGPSSPTITRYFEFSTVLVVALVLAALDIVLITALATLGALLYNLAATFAGGIQVTLSDE